MLYFIKIIRPLNAIFAMFTAFVGFWYLNAEVSREGLISSFFVGISTFLIASAGYVINDFFDFEIDKINQPQRVLPAGKISLFGARVYAFGLFIVGVVVAFFTKNPACITIAVVNSLSLYFYARSFKKRFLIGNLIVAWNSCSTFIYGAVLSNNFPHILPLAVFAFLYTIIREWVKCVEDCDGDIKNGVRSIAVVCSKQGTIRLLSVPVVLLICSLPAFYWLEGISLDLFLLLTGFITLPLVGFIWALNRLFGGEPTSTPPKNFEGDSERFRASIGKIQKLMKLNMLCIVLIFVVKDFIHRFLIMK